MKFTITTPLYYVNDKPHLGSLYTTIVCDAIARYKRLLGEDVLFITGVDEHGLKIQRKAKERKVTPQSHCDEISDSFIENWKKWEISFDSFIRTTSSHHENIVNEFFNKVIDSNDIYMGVQKGWYCVGCEEFKDNPENSASTQCPIHKKNLEWRDEENLFFRLSKYQKQIENIINQEDFIEPKERRNEITNFVSRGLKDFSISRTNLDWGIKVPKYNSHTFYVWFDALLGYISAISKEETNNTLNDSLNRGWPANIHIIGKDILRFHAVYWPAMLLSAGITPPKKVFGHGFLTREGQKMGKSLGNVLDPDLLLSRYGNDPVRWFLLKDISLGNDGDFQNKRFVDIINNDLANTIGNLLNRSASMSRKWFKNKTPFLHNKNDVNINEFANKTINKYFSYFDKYKIDLAANEILNFAIYINLYLNENEPWTLIKEEENIEQVKFIIYNVLESCRVIGLLLKPILPTLSEKILMQLGERDADHGSWRNRLNWGLLPLEAELPKPKPIIEKLEYE